MARIFLILFAVFFYIVAIVLGAQGDISDALMCLGFAVVLAGVVGILHRVEGRL